MLKCICTCELVVVNVSVYTAFRAVHCSVNKKCHIYQSGAIHVYDYLVLLNWIEWISFRTNFIPGFWRYNLMTTYPPLGTTTVSFSGGLSRLRPGIFPFAQSSFAHNEYLHSTSKHWMSWVKFVTSPVVIFTSGKAIFKTWKLWPCIWIGWSVAPLRLSKNHEQIQSWLLIAKHMELVCSKTNQVSFRTWVFMG